MRVTIFSSNQPRHLNLAKEFSKISDEVFFISEVKTLFPGEVDDFFKKSEIMQSYFKNVIASEKKFFKDIVFLPSNVKTFAIKSGDLNKLKESHLRKALSSDFYIIFGSSFIKSWLVDFLIEKQALNIHMGLSPYYRGSSCNFWALYDNNPSYVGATIHLLSKGLDSGDILFHCLPKVRKKDSPFEFTMRSVLVAQQGLVSQVENKNIFNFQKSKQNKHKELRYSRNKDFTDEKAAEFLKRNIKMDSIKFSYPDLINPIFG